MAGTGSSEAAVGANMPSAEAMTIVNPDICSPPGGGWLQLVDIVQARSGSRARKMLKYISAVPELQRASRV